MQFAAAMLWPCFRSPSLCRSGTARGRTGPVGNPPFAVLVFSCDMFPYIYRIYKDLHVFAVICLPGASPQGLHVFAAIFVPSLLNHKLPPATSSKHCDCEFFGHQLTSLRHPRWRVQEGADETICYVRDVEL